MKTVIASDIHGSAYYCGLLAEAVKSEGADCLLLLGDVLYRVTICREPMRPKR